MSAGSVPHYASQPLPPGRRLLRGYAFDPSLATQLDTAAVSEILYAVPWEPLSSEPYPSDSPGPAPADPPAKIPRGPRGEYIEVVDYDPPSGCFYAPVDLDDPWVLARNGLTPSEGNPQFHQQMVYAVTMTTIDRFERALGRKAMWADHWQRGENATKPEDEYVQRLRVYPHAFRAANAYYSRGKGSLMFGYFPATTDRDNPLEMPGGLVFTCLSHDIIAHETTHALLDGFHKHFMEPTNPDVLAFHEGFADIVALFQHFTFPEQLRHQIAKTRGDIGSSENLLSQLASQFGHASGSRGALRDFIGKYDAAGVWRPHVPRPSDLENATEVHLRGAILVAAVFEAFLSIYRRRTRDLLRLASGGTGVLARGDLHPDLVGRLADEAATAARHVLNICIRALDYCPPVDLSFGEYLRALVTADMDLRPEDPLRYRVAFIEAFRRRGIYPAGIRTLSEDSLRWSRPEEDPQLDPTVMKGMLKDFITNVGLRGYVDALRYCGTRQESWWQMRKARGDLHDAIRDEILKAPVLERLTGLALAPDSRLALASESKSASSVKIRRDGQPVFGIEAFREARRLGGDGRILNQVFITILQRETVDDKNGSFSLRCGSTLVINLDEMRVSYAISKGLGDASRIERIREYVGGGADLAAARTYLGESSEVFASLHQH